MFNKAVLAIVASKGGDILRVRIWGNPIVDADEDAVIENFCRQFDGRRKIVPLVSILTEKEVDSVIVNMPEDARYPFQHMSLMVNNNFLVRHTMALSRRKAIPDAEWYRSVSRNYEFLGEKADQLEKWTSPKIIDEYRKNALAAKNSLEDLARSVERGASSDAITSTVMEIRESVCTKCHSIPYGAGNQTIFDGVRLDFIAKGARLDFFRIGFDVWGMPGNVADSQNIAHLIKSAIITLNLTNRK